MCRKATVTGSAAFLVAFTCAAQNAPPAERSSGQPIYRVTIVSRTTKAINFSRAIPTNVDLKGTVLMPSARGRAVVESKRGSTTIEAHVSHMESPTRFGPEYLTYVVWAISPDGRAQNLGELVLNGSDKGKLTMSTNQQTFALIVTAEPHFSVTQPSDVVVAESAVRPDTVGKVEEVNATYELLPRQEYTYDKSAQTSAPGKPLPMGEYEAVLAVYQAQNAIQIAESQGAGKYAPQQIARARQLVDQARKYPRSLNKEVVAMGREATQLAEDARAISLARADKERAAAEQQEVAAARRKAELTEQAAIGEIQRAREAEDRAAAAQRRAAEEASFAERQAESRVTPPAPAPPTGPSAALSEPSQVRSTRRTLVAELNRVMGTIDTPRGIVVTVPENLVGTLPLGDRLARLASILKRYPAVRVDVQGYSNQNGNESATIAQGYADSVRSALVTAGLAAGSVQARGFGNSRLLTSNATAAGRQQNRRVEIVITGSSIGDTPTWDRSYSLMPRR